VKHDLKFSFDPIVDLFSTNKSVEYLQFANSDRFKLNLKDFNSLRFIEKNSTLKTLNLSFIQFNEVEMKVLNESLKMNSTLNSLDFSHSNFEGPFDFLGQNNLKKFSYIGIWNTEEIYFKRFYQNLKSSSLQFLDLSMDYEKIFVSGIEIEDVGIFIDVLSKLETLETLIISKLNESIDFNKILSNPKLKELHLVSGLQSTEAFKKLMNALNNNETLTLLDISKNYHINFKSVTEWDKIKITNQSLKTLQMSSKTKLN
jgi:hypothetical protein